MPRQHLGRLAAPLKAQPACPVDELPNPDISFLDQSEMVSKPDVEKVRCSVVLCSDAMLPLTPTHSFESITVSRCDGLPSFSSRSNGVLAGHSAYAQHFRAAVHDIFRAYYYSHV